MVVVFTLGAIQLILSNFQYRNSRTGARSTRTQIDHDVFEGLPVRHWRKRSFNVSTAPERDNLDLLGTGDTGWPELPMPRDAHMYSPMSEALLRAARMGQVKKPVTPLMDDEKEPGEDEDADGDLDMGFIAKRWAVIPKDLEGPEPEFLAKRRKGLPSVYIGATGPLGNTPRMRKTKIRKVDTEGNSYIWEVLVPDGQAVDGEIVEEETSPTQAPAPGTVVEGLGVVNAEGVVIAGDQAMPAANRRRPPPPKRKAKGPGRGRKKKVAFTPGAEGASAANGVSAVLNGSNAGTDDGESAKREHEAPDGDTEVGDEQVLPEGEEGSEEGSEGEEGEDGDREEGELSPSPTPAKSPVEPPTIIVNEHKVEPPEITDDVTSSPLKLPPSSLAEPGSQDNSDPMLLDEDDEPMNLSFSGPTVPFITHNTESTIDAATVATTANTKGTMTTPESNSKPKEAVQVPYVASMAEPQTEIQMELLTAPDTMTQPQPEHVEGLVTDRITDSFAEQPLASPAESLTKPEIEPKFGVPADRMTDVAVSTAESGAEQPLAFGDITNEAVPERKTDNTEPVLTTSVPVSFTDAALEPTTDTILSLTTKPMSAPRKGLEAELPSGLPTNSVADPIEEPKPVTVQPMDERPLLEPSVAEQPVIEQPASEQPVIEQPASEQPASEQPVLEQPGTEQPGTEQPGTEQPGTEQPGTEQPGTEQHGTEQPATKQPVMEQPMTEQPVTDQPMTEQPVIQQPVLEQPLTVQSTIEQPITVPPMTEPSVKQLAEPHHEAVSPERRFSYTRVTTSPQAPTPSPPTPIENKFGLKAPYLSPKAPTMSPPTPIERSMSSSPDIPLADQHFRLPPHIDVALEASHAPAPDMLPNPSVDGTLVNTVLNVDPQVNTQIAAEGENLVGMTEPGTVEESEGSTQHFTDGEEDLLGSLERSLGK